MRTPTQYLLSENVVVDIENVTGGREYTDEGIVDITSEVTFTVIYKNLRFGVEAHHIDDDHDMYRISIYDQSSEPNRYRRENDNEISCAFLDSTGGGTMGEVLSTGYEVVDNAIMDVLFGNNNIEPYIKPF